MVPWFNPLWTRWLELMVNERLHFIIQRKQRLTGRGWGQETPQVPVPQWPTFSISVPLAKISTASPNSAISWGSPNTWAGMEGHISYLNHNTTLHDTQCFCFGILVWPSASRPHPPLSFLSWTSSLSHMLSTLQSWCTGLMTPPFWNPYTQLHLADRMPCFLAVPPSSSFLFN